MNKVIGESSESSSGVEFKIACLKAGIKQYQLASEVNLTSSQLSEFENGRWDASQELPQKINSTTHTISYINKKVSLDE